jgi:hypothetical protein
VAESLRDIEFDDDVYDDHEGYDAEEEAMSNCCAYPDTDGRLICGAAGSEDCDFECPFNRDLGMTLAEIEERDVEEAFEACRQHAAARSADCEPWFDGSAFDDISNLEAPHK